MLAGALLPHLCQSTEMQERLSREKIRRFECAERCNFNHGLIPALSLGNSLSVILRKELDSQHAQSIRVVISKESARGAVKALGGIGGHSEMRLFLFGSSVRLSSVDQ